MPSLQAVFCIQCPRHQCPVTRQCPTARRLWARVGGQTITLLAENELLFIEWSTVVIFVPSQATPESVCVRVRPRQNKRNMTVRFYDSTAQVWSGAFSS